jgi:hypothetical protein
LGEAILHGARFANRKYWPLLNEYDLVRGATDPQAGLNANLRASVAELFGLAVTGWARVLERAAADAEATRRTPLPAPSLSIPTVLATLRVPMRLWRRWVIYRREQVAIEELVDEFRQTGSLTQHLPTEVDIIRRVVRVYDDDRKWKREREARLASNKTIVKVVTRDQDDALIKDEMPSTIPFAPRVASSEVRTLGSLAATDALIEAPSIGPKTAARFTAIEVHTVGEFLAASAEETASRLGTYWITADTVTLLQSQAKLMCEVPGLRSGEAQLLAGAGYDSVTQVARCDPAVLHREVSEFAATTTGRRYLRGSAPPSLAVIKRWIGNAAETALASRPRRRSA